MINLERVIGSDIGTVPNTLILMEMEKISCKLQVCIKVKLSKELKEIQLANNISIS